MTSAFRWRDAARRTASLLLLAPLASADTGSNEQSTSQSFQISAQVEPGCVLGSGPADTGSFGTIDFGRLGHLASDVTAVSSSGSGSVVLQCTPNTPITIAIDAGLHGSGGARYLAKGSETLRYQLYQDEAFSIVWGDNRGAGTAMSLTFPATGAQTLPIYARLFRASVLPSAGIYSDVVTVTVTY
ncbi:spore coat protein [Stutzerimonas nosocomialis]|uniref:Csu type fimbrial protein n=1 Tax=Stutzerimonas nosocomialis TaxID=1056496 RepID=UPI001108ED2D|nr:spore coat U domain-containing protein [Stutzerimonas nosocomialis]TLX54414.1 spore coat protein [Stutzerimonas nosocomialis]